LKALEFLHALTISRPTGEQDMSGTTKDSRVETDFWPKLVQNLAHLPFAEEVAAAYYCAFDKATPYKVKGTLVAALAYFILPIDIIPDFLLGFGFTDDLAVLMLALKTVRSNVTQAHHDQASAKIAELRAASAHQTEA
jgi:uncharacterized membrane protein YkvA (DUF1232 family)